jgi:hypothetical protein
MMSGLRVRRLWAAVACVSTVTGCSPSQSHDWQGYYYENVLVNTEPTVSEAYPSAQICLAAMHDYYRNAPRSAGFVCARGCPEPKDGYTADCQEVAR